MNHEKPTDPTANENNSGARLGRRNLLLSAASLLAASAIPAGGLTTPAQAQPQGKPNILRSEERRVGKECRL